jgi:glycosyltransferase involved in cell wall biosynthesis
MTAPTFSIVVPTFKRPDALKETLSALLGLDYPTGRYEVIVVDDGADDLTARIIDEHHKPGVSVTLEAQDHRGAACARNRGATLAGGEWVLFCDDDILAPPSHLCAHLAVHERHANAVVAGTWTLPPAMIAALSTTPFGRYRIDLERRFAEAARGEPLDGDPSCVRMAAVAAANLSLRRELFWRIGGFDEHFPSAGAEDQDLSVRARSLEAVLVLGTKIRCVHNDAYVTLRQYCDREERSARTMPFLVRKYPSEFENVPYARENRPIEVGDPPRLVAKKAGKALLAYEPVLEGLHRLTGACETARAPERVLRRLYTTLLGLHLFRGFRQSWNA